MAALSLRSFVESENDACLMTGSGDATSSVQPVPPHRYKGEGMKVDWGWLKDVNWGRLTLVFPIIAFVLCFMAMVWNFVDGDFTFGAIMATCCAVNTWAFVAIWKNTERYVRTWDVGEEK